MILKSIKIQNFRKFENIKIEFPLGIIGVFGLNGVGKSTIFEAFSWALYGPIAARTSSDKIKREGSSPLEKCRVEVVFVFNQNTIRVIREMSGKNLFTSATAYVNNRMVASGADATTKFIQNLFGMDAKTFFTSIFAKQKEINVLSSMHASERKQLIMRMLGIDALDKAIRNIRSDIRKSQEIINHYKISIKDEITGRNKEEIYIEEIKRDEEKIASVDQDLKEKEKDLKVLSQELNNLENKKMNIQKSYEEIRSKLDEERKKKDLFERRKRLEKEIEKLKRSIEDRRVELSKKERERRNLLESKEEFDDVEKEIERIREVISKIISEIGREKARIDGFEREKRKIESKKSKIETLGPSAPCPTCGRILGDHYTKLMNDFDKEIKNSEVEIEKIKNKISQLEEERDRNKKLEDALNRKRRYLLDIRMKEQRASASIQSILREIDREKREIEDREKEIESIGEIKFDENTYLLLEKRLNMEYEKYKNSTDEIRNKQIEVDKIKERIKEIEGEKKLLQQHIDDLKQRIREIEKMKRRMIEEEDKLSKLRILESVMGDFRLNMISRIRPTLSAYASTLLGVLTDGKYSEMELNENYDILIYDGGVPYEIGRFSGGEEDLANLCIRLSISQVLTDRAGGEFNLIILDEIFGSQDVNRRRNIIGALNSLSSRFKQIFIITHIEEIKQMVNNAITVYESEKEVSKIKME